MIKSFITYTEEEVAQRQALSDQLRAAYAALDTARKEPDADKRSADIAAASAEINRIDREHIRMMGAARRRYIDELKANPDQALENIGSILKAYTKEDFLKQMEPLKAWQEKLAAQLEGWIADPNQSEEAKRGFKKDLAAARRTLATTGKKNYASAVLWLNSTCQDELKALEGDPVRAEKAAQLIEAKAASLYKPRSGSAKTPASQTAREYVYGVQMSIFDELFLPMARSAATDALMLADPRTLTPDPLRGGAAILRLPDSREISNHTIIFHDLGKYSTKRGEPLGVPALKLIDASQAIMTANNPHRPDDLTRINPTVLIDTKEYARANGVRIDAEKKDTPEDQRRENEAVKGNLRDFMTTLKKSAQQLYDIGQEWEEVDAKGRTVKYQAVRMVSGVSVNAQYIKLNFDADVARSIMAGHMSQYPTSLLSLDGRKPVPYRLGRKLAIQNSMVNNRARGTANTLSVEKALEAVPQIPTYESIIESGRKDWKKRICGALEAALDDLCEARFLRSWSYRSRSLGNLTPEASRALRWEDYKELYIDFELEDESTKPSQLAAKGAELKQLYAGKKKHPRKRRK